MSANKYILPQAEFIASPNYNEFPTEAVINAIIIHCISLPEGNYGGEDVIKLFCNRLDCSSHSSYADLADVHVSSHLFIRRDGHLIQFVPLNKRAWHAGESQLGNQFDCNNFSIGIELEGCDQEGYEKAQYQQLADVTQQLIKIYPKIKQKRIVGHSDVAPDRKTDPGNYFDWQKYFALLS